MRILLPLDARIKVGWVTGRELRNYLEHELELVFSRNPLKLSGGWGPRASGMTLKFAAKAPDGSRLREVLINNQPLQDNAHYTFAGCEREGEPLDVVCRMHGFHDVRVVSPSIHQALITYLQKHPVISPHREKREIAIDLPDKVFSQDKVLSSEGLISGDPAKDPFRQPAGYYPEDE
jgi:S-sulfosulfanyl-L-cysteine sulfohydrolase